MKLFLDSEGFWCALQNGRSLLTASNRIMYEINICLYLSYICMQCSNNIWISFNELFNILCAYLQILLRHINFIYTFKNWLPKNSFVQQFEVRKLYHSCFGTLSQENKLFPVILIHAYHVSDSTHGWPTFFWGTSHTCGKYIDHLNNG